MKQEFSVIIPIFFQNSFVIPSNNSCNTIWAIRQNSKLNSYMYMVNFLWCNIEWKVKTTFLLYMRSSFLTSFMFDSKYYVVHTGHRESLDSLSNSVLKVMKKKWGLLCAMEFQVLSLKSGWISLNFWPIWMEIMKVQFAYLFISIHLLVLFVWNWVRKTNGKISQNLGKAVDSEVDKSAWTMCRTIMTYVWGILNFCHYVDIL